MKTSATFTIHISTYRATVGLSLRGRCDTPAAATQLEQAIAEVMSYGQPFIWVDCQRLAYLSWQAQRAILNVSQQARLAGSTIYWCGFLPGVLTQLADTGLHLLLTMLPAAAYQGPATLLQETVPTAPHTHKFMEG
ncbi:STAS domain-containing protein [Hymenobacter sp. BRD67]|uniref:STAS domain-containing protein n=1 Tax=Hymenobacter sp. BRD67 TaxID=2675877 RepID=UPI0015674977|nr:hypothetical protein [Hymenobacter sp. BRD67]QKG54128.1 hypothetical protein GKZ67_17910 [Hymenobacter sp. BRD67]